MNTIEITNTTVFTEQTMVTTPVTMTVLYHGCEVLIYGMVQNGKLIKEGIHFNRYTIPGRHLSYENDLAEILDEVAEAMQKAYDESHGN